MKMKNPKIYSVLPQTPLLQYLRGLLLRGVEGRGREEGKEREGKGREARGNRENDLKHPCRKFLAMPLQGRHQC